jgi:hypothetical protein
MAVTAAAVVAPALESIGWWDHWPSWSVYSSRPAIVQTYVNESAVDRLPPSLQPFVAPPAPLQSWREVNFDRWSYDRLYVPPYPQERWKLAHAAAVFRAAGLSEEFKATVQVREGWWSRNRKTIELEGADAVNERLSRFWLNVRPRSRIRMKAR